MGVAEATELRHITVRTGTDGLAPVALTVAHDSTAAITCNAEIAHWYSMELATAAPGASAAIELWFDPATGTYSALNDRQENLPIERLWCGFSGRAYETRALIALDRTAGKLPGALNLSCTSADEGLSCE